MNELSQTRLREFLFKEFDEEGLATLCQDLGLDYEKLPGVGAFGKSRELIAAVQARRAMPALIARLKELRPAAWRIAGLRVSVAETGAASPVAPEASAEPATPPRRAWPRLLLVLLAIACLVAAGVAAGLPRMLAERLGGMSATPAGIAVSENTATQSPTAVVESTATLTAASATLPPAPAATDTPAPTGTPAPTSTSAATPSATFAPSSTPTPTATPAPDAAQALVEINDALAGFYSGQVSAAQLRTLWAGDSYTTATGYAARAVKKGLGIDLGAGDTLSVTMHYLKSPVVTAQSGARTQLTAQEYWRYTHSPGGQVLCEIVDYQYTLLRSAGRYQVIAYKGDVISSTVGSACGD